MARVMYRQLSNMLTTRFEPPEQVPTHEAHFRLRQKKANETRVDLATAPCNSADCAFPGQGGNLLDRIVFQQFIEGKPSSEIRVLLASNRPANLDTAVRHVVQAEAAYHMEARRAHTEQTLRRSPKIPGPIPASVSHITSYAGKRCGGGGG